MEKHFSHSTKISLVSPSQGDKVKKNCVHTISWTDSGCLSINIWISCNGGISWFLIASSVPNTHYFDWWVRDVICTKNCLLKVVGDGCFYDTCHLEILE
jgi:hypothetical protein